MLLVIVYNGNFFFVKFREIFSFCFFFVCFSVSVRFGFKLLFGFWGCYFEVVDVVFGIKVNALGFFVDGYDR